MNLIVENFFFKLFKILLFSIKIFFLFYTFFNLYNFNIDILINKFIIHAIDNNHVNCSRQNNIFTVTPICTVNCCLCLGRNDWNNTSDICRYWKNLLREEILPSINNEILPIPNNRFFDIPKNNVINNFSYQILEWDDTVCLLFRQNERIDLESPQKELNISTNQFFDIVAGIF